MKHIANFEKKNNTLRNVGIGLGTLGTIGAGAYLLKKRKLNNNVNPSQKFEKMSTRKPNIYRNVKQTKLLKENNEPIISQNNKPTQSEIEKYNIEPHISKPIGVKFTGGKFVSDSAKEAGGLYHKVPGIDDYPNLAKLIYKRSGAYNDEFPALSPKVTLGNNFKSARTKYLDYMDDKAESFKTRIPLKDGNYTKIDLQKVAEYENLSPLQKLVNKRQEYKLYKKQNKKVRVKRKNN